MQAFGQDFFVILSLLEVKKGQIMSLHWAFSGFSYLEECAPIEKFVQKSKKLRRVLSLT